MNNENQKDININQQKFLNQLELLAEQAATAQAQIASDAAKHEFRVRFNHYLHEKMEVATATSTRALDVESKTVRQINEFKPVTPQFASFSETLAQQRSKQSDLFKLNEVELNSDADKQALQSLGVSPENNYLDAQQIETNFIATNENNHHNGNGVTFE